MLTKFIIRNFKKLGSVEIELGESVVFIGPNNSGKTTALQALALWDVGVKIWNAKREGKASPKKRLGVTINRKDLLSIPAPVASLLWKDMHVRAKAENGSKGTQNIRIEIIIQGITNGKTWECGLEFDYSNEESFICRPLRLPDYNNAKVEDSKFSEIPLEALNLKVAYLPPMSGLASEEAILLPGRINVLIGQGQTAQVLRNMCHQIYSQDENHENWKKLCEHISRLFGVGLLPPQPIAARGEINMSYIENSQQLDLSSSGRGLQQVMLLLAHLYANPGSILLLDEPDAHLEVLRQREIFRLLNDTAVSQGSQIVAASHSEVVLNEAATTGTVIAFIGNPHRINDRGSQLLKALTDIGWEQYYNAEQMGWVLYLESASDLAILKAFAALLNNSAAQNALQRPFVHYVASNLPQKAREHFYGIKEAKPNLIGIAIFDHMDKELEAGGPLKELMWGKREIENYFCDEEVLLSYAVHDQPDDLFGHSEAERRKNAMREAIAEISKALKAFSKPEPWSSDLKATDDFLEPVFKQFFEKLSLPITMRKSEYYQLTRFLTASKLDAEVSDKLNAIVEVANKANPGRG